MIPLVISQPLWFKDIKLSPKTISLFMEIETFPVLIHFTKCSLPIVHEKGMKVQFKFLPTYKQDPCQKSLSNT